MMDGWPPSETSLEVGGSQIKKKVNIMESTEAIEMVKSIQIDVAQDGHRLAMGQKAAIKRLEKSASDILGGLLGRKATKEEIQESTRW
tara:strand:+ start:612 stop:875 length:264 start_codon:yes stop_codon:yes gene_type:complete